MGRSKNHEFWCSDSLMRYLSISSWITQFWVLWTRLWSIYWRLCRIHRNWEHLWTGDFTEKLVLIGSLKNCNFCYVDILMSYLSNAFWITLSQVLWKKLWSFCYDCADWTEVVHGCVLAQL